MRKSIVLLLVVLVTALNSFGATVGPAFGYQGRLNDNGSPADGNYDLKFTLYDSTGGSGVAGGPITNTAVAISDGLFNVQLDFGADVFTGSNYWLEVSVRTNGTATFAVLTPRQPLLPVPYALFAPSAATAATATTALTANSVPAANISGSIQLTQLAGAVITNNQNGVTLSGTFSGNGGGLTALNASELAGGTVPDARLSANVPFLNGSATFAGTLTATTFNGSGAGLNNIPASSLTGTISDTQLGPNIPRLDVPNTSEQATGHPVVTSGFITSAVVDNGGSNYATAPAVTVNDAAGSGAVIVAQVSVAGVVTNLMVQNAGTGYSAGATLTIALPPSNAYQVFVSTNIFSNQNFLTNVNNVIAGNGANLTSLNGSQITSGTVADGRLSGNVALLNRDPQTFTGLNNFGGTIVMTDPTKTLQFPVTAGANVPMMTMFAAGTGNADRMVIGHSPSFPTWGLQYQDSRDKFNFLGAGLNAMTVDLGSLRVGVNTNGPVVALDVFGTQSIGPNSDGIVNIGNSALAHITLDNNQIDARNGTNAADLFLNDFGGNVYIAGGVLSAVGGKVGIGNGTPANSLQVNGGVLARGGPPGGFGANNNGYAFSGNSGDNDSGMFSEADDTLNFYCNAIQVFNMTDSGIAFVNPTTSISFPATTGANAPMIYMFGSGTANANRMVIAHSPNFPSYGLQYQDNQDKFNFLSAGATVMTVDLGFGRVGIGTASPTFQLQLSSDSAGKPNGGSWANSSDARVKKNIQQMTDGLDKLTKLRGVTFEWVNPEDHANQTGIQAGFVAQEVEKVFPNWVHAVPGADHDKALTPDGNIKSLALPFEFDALLVEALKQLRAEKDAQIAELQKDNLELRREIAAQKELASVMQEQFKSIEKAVSRLSAKPPVTTFAVNQESLEAK